MLEVLFGIPIGFLLWFFVRYGVGGFYTVGPNERAVITTFGRAQRTGSSTLEEPIGMTLRPDERERYAYPQVRVIGPGFYWKLPWQDARKVSVATNTVSIAYDPESMSANSNGQILDAVTKDQLNTGLNGQLRFTISERNLYAYVFGVKNPVAHIMGYFVSVLRDRIANFEAPEAAGVLAGVGLCSGCSHAKCWGSKGWLVFQTAKTRWRSLRMQWPMATSPRLPLALSRR